MYVGFTDRIEAAKRLAAALAHYRGKNPLVMAIPRGAVHNYLKQEQHARLDILKQRRALYTPGRAPIDPAGRIVLVVDDGLATGATMIAALHAVRVRAPAKLICAVPVAALDSLELVGPYADEAVCLEAPENFYAVGQFYRSFPQVEDEEVVALLGTPPITRAAQHD